MLITVCKYDVRNSRSRTHQTIIRDIRDRLRELIRNPVDHQSPDIPQPLLVWRTEDSSGIQAAWSQPRNCLTNLELISLPATTSRRRVLARKHSKVGKVLIALWTHRLGRVVKMRRFRCRVTKSLDSINLSAFFEGN